MIDHESNDYDFIIFSIAQQICEQLKISLVELIKLQIVKNYDDRLRLVIIHVIYSFMTIQNHTENLASLMITQLINHSIILKRSWIKKHEIMYDDHDNSLIFFLKHCNHLEALDHSFSKILSNMKSKLIEKAVSANFSSKTILRRDSQQTSWKLELKEDLRSTTKQKKKSTAKDKLARIESSLKKKTNC